MKFSKKFRKINFRQLSFNQKIVPPPSKTRTKVSQKLVAAFGPFNQLVIIIILHLYYRLCLFLLKNKCNSTYEPKK